MKQSKTVRTLAFILILALFWLVASCNRHKLPPVKDAAALRNDCAVLYEQFPVSELSTNDYEQSLGIRKIPQDKWLPTIVSLHPYMVCSYQGGIQMWIYWPGHKDEGKFWNGYYVSVKSEQPPPPQAATNRFVIQRTDHDGVFLLKQSKFQN